MKRKIAAIMAAAIVKSELPAANDPAGARAIADETVTRYGGRTFKTAGESTLAEFPSSVEAVRCALEIQEGLRTVNLGLPADQHTEFRIGINVGDIVERDGDLLGDGVNIALRLENLAEAGGICVSRTVFEQVANKLTVGFAEIASQDLKSGPAAIRAYVVASGERPPIKPRLSAQRRNISTAILTAAIVISVSGAITWMARTSPRGGETQPSPPPAATREFAPAGAGHAGSTEPPAPRTSATTTANAAPSAGQPSPTSLPMTAPVAVIPDAQSFSLTIWPAGTLRRGETRSADTAHGKLTCIGGGNIAGSGPRRNCSWR